MPTPASWMALALDEARAAATAGEVPVGAVVVHGGKILGRGHNSTEADSDPSAHAEIHALRAAAKALGDWRLEGATLVVTLEPCAMCVGATVLARVARLIYGAADPRLGACGSVIDLTDGQTAPHLKEVQGGVLAEECGKLLRQFFHRLRQTDPGGVSGNDSEDGA
ncbi:MAG: tRNA adenosine(34) deaminase TadA [Acidobacteriota bacterium]